MDFYLRFGVGLVMFTRYFILYWDCRDEYYAWGLHQIAKAVSFLNNDCKLVSIREPNMVFSARKLLFRFCLTSFVCCRFTVMFAWIVLSSRKLWTGNSMRLMFCQSLMGVMMVPLGRCW